MKFLIIDDDAAERESFQAFLKEFYAQHEAIFTDNLLDFDELLFQSGEVYDRIIIDAQLEWPPEIAGTESDAFLQELGLKRSDEADTGELLGWKYFDQYMRQQRGYDPEKVLIKTGFTVSIQTSAPQERLTNVNLLNKGDPDYTEKVKKFLNGR